MRGEPGDHSGLDPDGDGLACNEEATVSPPVIIPISSPQISPTNIRANITPSNLTAPIEGLARVLDGDTIQIGMTRIRLYGIDAFEGEQQCKTSEDNVYGCGGRATRALEEKIADQAVSCAQRGTDAYGRTLAVCRVNSLDLSSYMARSGHALAYVKYALDYVSDEATAKEIKAGAHGGSFEAPSAYRLTRTSGAAEAQRSLAPSSECTIKGHVTKEGKRIYHLTSDPYYTRTKPENWFCSESEAEQAGFRRAGRPN